jgi:hypothetical protein
MQKFKSAENIPLVPLKDFKESVKKVLSVSKNESDSQLAAIQAANVKRRAAKKKAV